MFLNLIFFQAKDSKLKNTIGYTILIRILNYSKKKKKISLIIIRTPMVVTPLEMLLDH